MRARPTCAPTGVPESGPQLPALGREPAAAGASQVSIGAKTAERCGAQRQNRSDSNEGEADLRAEPAAAGASQVSIGAKRLSGVERSDKTEATAMRARPTCAPTGVPEAGRGCPLWGESPLLQEHFRSRSRHN